MKKTLLASTLLLFTACANEPQFATYEIFPHTAALQRTTAESADVHIQMIIGSNGCYRFKEMRSDKLGDTQRVRFYGEQDITPGVMCTMAIVEMDEVLTIKRLEGVQYLRFTMKRGGDTTIALTE